MIAKFCLPAVLAGLLFATAAGAQAGVEAHDAPQPAGGGTASIRTLPDGRTVATLNRRSKTCKAGQIPIATGGPATITNTKGTRTYPKGVLICLDPADFGGGARVSVEGGTVVVKPETPATPAP
ncbi:hypothetical protein [Asticcacaulis solisilvae]|uniref:hypothetical protein n=1 Tax=Asticcacaulis solisilvae TaxID=1217274 RepID=UPI003FD81D29